MSTPTSVILYRYNASPFSVKVDNALLIKGISHKRVKVQHALPRPDITLKLGINYRKIPILAIGNDVYCDTSLILSALERRFPHSRGYGTLFPARKGGEVTDTGLVKALSKSWMDTIVFPIAPSLLAWKKMPQSFLDDRSAFMGRTINPDDMAALQGASVSLLSSHWSLVEEQLMDGREWLFDTVTPGLADLSVHFVFAWIRPFPASKPLYNAQVYPKAVQWLDRMKRYLDGRKEGKLIEINGEEAAKLIVSSSAEASTAFDAEDAALLGLALGQTVSIFPDDSGRNYPTEGILVGLTREECTIEVRGSAGTVRCHFPRIGFTVKRVSKVAKL